MFLLCITIFLFIGVKRRSRQLLALTSQLNSNLNKQAAAEMNIVTILIGIATIQCAFFVPYVISYMLYSFLNNEIALKYLAILILGFSIFVHSTNFIFYFIRLRSFRNTLFCKSNSNRFRSRPSAN